MIYQGIDSKALYCYSQEIDIMPENLLMMIKSKLGK